MGLAIILLCTNKISLAIKIWNKSSSRLNRATIIQSIKSHRKSNYSKRPLFKARSSAMILEFINEYTTLSIEDIWRFVVFPIAVGPIFALLSQPQQQPCLYVRRGCAINRNIAKVIAGKDRKALPEFYESILRRNVELDKEAFVNDYYCDHSGGIFSLICVIPTLESVHVAIRTYKGSIMRAESRTSR